MPIHCPLSIARLEADEFDKVDYRVMGHAYACQNELGRLCDERVFEADLKARLIADGFRSVGIQIPITVAHADFKKTYFLDLIADDALFELKADTALVAEHEAQLLNYMFLLGLGRAKLLNFRTPKVQGKIVATSLTHEDRRRFALVIERWVEFTPECKLIHQTMLRVLADWGAFLDFNLYQTALIHFLGGVEKTEQRIKLSRSGMNLGTQRMLCHAPELAFRVTAVTRGQQSIESNLRRLLALSNLKAIQWINLNHAHIEFTTIVR